MSLETCKSSGSQSADAVIYAGSCKIYGVCVIQAAAASTVYLYDNATAATGTLIAAVTNVTNSTAVNFTFDVPIECLSGCYADMTGVGATYIVYYSPMG